MLLECLAVLELQLVAAAFFDRHHCDQSLAGCIAQDARAKFLVHQDARELPRNASRNCLQQAFVYDLFVRDNPVMLRLRKRRRELEHAVHVRMPMIERQKIKGSADQINFDPSSGVARIFCSRCAKFLRLTLRSRPIFQFLRLFRGFSRRFLRHLAHYGRSSPLTMYKLLKANSTLSWASFLAKPL